MGRTVLIVDQDLVVRRMASQMLENAGYAMYEAADGEEALRLLADQGDGIDLMFIDTQLPAPIDGWVLASLAASRWEHLGIIICGPGSEIFADYVPKSAVVTDKPFDQNVVHDFLNGHLNFA